MDFDDGDDVNDSVVDDDDDGLLGLGLLGRGRSDDNAGPVPAAPLTPVATTAAAAAAPVFTLHPALMDDDD